MIKNLLVDLHVHTPASDDYNINADSDIEASYLNIIKLASEKNVDVIGIADHFNVSGYEKLIELKNETKNLALLMKKEKAFENVPQLQTIIDREKLFESVYIMMAVEINVSPGIHYIIVFSEHISPCDVRSFLYELDENIDKKYGSPSHMIEITSIDLFKKAKYKFGDECFIYAPHANQNSGIIKELKGQARQNILKNEDLLGISFNQETDREYIQNNIMVHIKRKNDLKFIQDSDYHGKDGQSIGDMYFYIDNTCENNNVVNYEVVKSALTNSTIIRTSSDTAIERYSNATKNKVIYDFRNNNFIEINLEPDFDCFLKTVCAITNMNNNKYLIVIEGQTDDKKDKNEVIGIYSNKLMTELKNNLIIERIKVSQYPISKSKIKLVLQIFNNSRLNIYNNVCYVIDNENSIKVARSNEIESIVSEKMYNKFGRIKDAKLQLMSQQLVEYNQELKTYACIYKVVDNIVKFFDFNLNVIKVDNNFQELYKYVALCGNGQNNGNTIILNQTIQSGINCGRYEHSYLRLTAPYGESATNALNSVKDRSILITKYGAVMYVEKESNILTSIELMCIEITDSTISIKKLIMYLRSTLLLWIITKNFMAVDIYDFLSRLSKPSIPIINTLFNSDSDIIEHYFDELFELENNFLKEEKTIIKNSSEYSNEEYNNQLDNLIKCHNENADLIMKKVDQVFYNLCKFNENDIKQIEDDLGRMKIYCWK